MLQTFKCALRTSLIILLFSLNCVQGSQLFAQNDPEVTAKNYFEEGNFEEALPIFQDLIRLYPSDEEINYFYGACLIETNTFLNEAQQALETAIDDQAKALYYLGKYYHAQSNWVFASSYYEDFKDSAKKREVKNTDVDELLDLCSEEINPFPKAEEIITREDTKPELTLETQLENPISETTDSLKEEIITEPEILPIEIPDELKETIINFRVNSAISYLKISQFKTDEGQQAYIEGWLKEQELKNKLSETEKLRNSYASAFTNEKENLANKIIELEQETYQINREITNHYSKANQMESNYWESASSSEVEVIIKEITEIKDSIQAANTIATSLPDIQKEDISIQIVPQDSISLVISESTPETSNTTDIISYKIQIGAYSKTPPDWVQNLFKKISVIRKIDQYTDDRGVTVYTIGELNSYDDALEMQEQIRKEGISDAFVAAYKNNERITVSEARKLSGE